ncbi:MAG: hypothetical protein R5N75_08885 [Cutibacterium granulosum]|uniref:hypothetical protein n=1 Tax=Cutibacterium granulosum TaxID=33011 RepID=UPI002B22EF2E|nr:hypothetical protein [Cutibacterium granulosum]MEA5660206.1 hypothetical protein [Cutibacterium granulosum]
MRNHVNMSTEDSPLPSMDVLKIMLFSMDSCLRMLCSVEEEARHGNAEPLTSLLESVDDYRLTHVESDDGDDEVFVSMAVNVNSSSVELGRDIDGVYICMTAHDIVLSTYLESMSRQAVALEIVLHEAQRFAMSRMDEYGDNSDDS